MIKKSFLAVLFFVIFIIVSMNFSQGAQSFILGATNSIKVSFLDVVVYAQEFVEKHTNQAETIKELRSKNIEFEKNLYLLKAATEELKSLKNSLKTKVETNNTLHLARVISYTALGDYHKVWLQSSDSLKEDGVYGLIHRGNVAGIARFESGRLMGLLNGDEKCSYSVFVGKNRAPGIVRGEGLKSETVIDYIPSWIEIDTNESVITSGMDSIFFEGINVGSVTKIEKTQGYQKAWVRLKEDIFDARYFFLVELSSSN